MIARRCIPVFVLFSVLVAPISADTSKLRYRVQSVVVDGNTYQARLPAGYTLELLTGQLDGPRLLTFADNGDLFIGSKSGNVYRLPAPYTKPGILVDMGGYPHSVALRKGEILIAEQAGLYRAPYQPGQKSIRPDQLKLLAAIPAGIGHSSRTVGIGPDGRVYVALGISGNCSNEYLHRSYPVADRRGGIMVLREESGSAQFETFATGLRNPVGFDWHPQSGIMYASNNGPDHQGFELPPEYFSEIRPGSFHGMPWYQYDGKKIRRDSCINTPPPQPVSKVVPPVATFPARNAPMGVAFIPRGAMDSSMRNDAVVALRGSWGTRPSGGFLGSKASRRPPKLVLVRFDNGKAVRVDDLVTGFQLADGERWARPVGVAIGPDGALYFTSDSGANALFRLGREKHPARSK